MNLHDSEHQTDHGRSAAREKWDVFISHASEDKAYVDQLATALRLAGLTVWYDNMVLEWGDDLRSMIDNGLVNCRFGIVVLSRTFLGKKKWTEHELNGLFAREHAGRKLLLPIWHGIGRDDLLEYSPALADRLAKIAGRDSLDDIVESLLKLMERPVPDAQKHAKSDQVLAYRRRFDKRWAFGGVVLLTLAAVGFGIQYLTLTAKRSPFVAGPDIGKEDTRTTLKDGLTYVHIEPGEFWMGAVPGDIDADRPDSAGETPRHRVKITKPFWMTATPVTVAAYKTFVRGQSAVAMPPEPSFNLGWTKEEHPIVNVTWQEAQAYCGWADPAGRLPTEAEWEYAARGGNEGLKYPWGAEITGNDATYSINLAKWNGTSPVRSYKANAWGLYDMAGNVWEWVADWYDKDYYRTFQNVTAVDPQRTQPTEWRVLRGGSFRDDAWRLRASARGWSDPGGRFYGNSGFRCIAR